MAGPAPQPGIPDYLQMDSMLDPCAGYLGHPFSKSIFRERMSQVASTEKNVPMVKLEPANS
jgi:hypothetical protein